MEFFYPVYQERMLMNLDLYAYPQNLYNGFELMRNAVKGEKEDELFYNDLIQVAPSTETKEIITSIRDDEVKHNQMFRTIYYQLTNQVLPRPTQDLFIQSPSFCEGIVKALKGELRTVERYRQIMLAMQNRIHMNMLTEIISDELRHSSMYNVLYSKHCLG